MQTFDDHVHELLRTLPIRVSDVVRPWAERLPNRPALVERGGTWTYGRLASVIAETQRLLVDAGVRPGDRVMIVCENCRALVALFVAVAGLDAWPVLVNARLSHREIDDIRDHCDPRRVVYTISVPPYARTHSERHGAGIREMDGLGRIAIGPLNETAEPEPIESDPSENIAALIYTSGSTGRPKGVKLTHRNLLFVAAVSGRIRSLTPDDRIYGVLPMSHIVGLSVVLLGSLLNGSTLYIAPRFDPAAALPVLQQERLTILLGVPAMFALLVEYARSKGLRSIDCPELRIISASGSPLDLATKSAAEGLFGLVLHHGYGVTECAPTIAQTRLEAPRSDTSVGRVFPGVEVKLVGFDREQVGDGEVGELWVRGPNVMTGYYKAPDETAAAIDPEGWFNTRDLAYLEDENLFIVGRTKELIVRFGFNVYPAEVEAVLNAHPAVARSAVIGRAGKADEEVIAFVLPVFGSPVTVAELADHAAQHLASYKRPTEILFVSEMPTSSAGKILKERLASPASELIGGAR